VRSKHSSVSFFCFDVFPSIFNHQGNQYGISLFFSSLCNEFLSVNMGYIPCTARIRYNADYMSKGGCAGVYDVSVVVYQDFVFSFPSSVCVETRRSHVGGTGILEW